MPLVVPLLTTVICTISISCVNTDTGEIIGICIGANLVGVALVAASLWYNARYPQLTPVHRATPIHAVGGSTSVGRRSASSAPSATATSVEPRQHATSQKLLPTARASDGHSAPDGNVYDGIVVHPASTSPRPGSRSSTGSAIIRLPPPPTTPPPPPTTTAWAGTAPTSDEFDGFGEDPLMHTNALPGGGDGGPDTAQTSTETQSPHTRQSWGVPIVPHRLEKARPSWEEPVLPSTWVASTTGDADTEGEATTRSSRTGGRRSSKDSSRASKRSSSKRGSKRVSKLDISGPSDFRHEGHIGIDDPVDVNVVSPSI